MKLTMTPMMVMALAVGAIICLGTRPGFGAPQTWTGTISDSQCGGEHGGEVDERECTEKCIKNGEQYVLVTDFGKTVWKIANQSFAALKENPGRTVKVTGELKDGAIVIDKMEKP